MDSATRGSRRVLRPFSDPSLVHTRSRSPSRPTQTGTLWGEPSAMRVARCAKFGRSMSAMASADSGVGMDTLLGISMGCRRKADLKPKLKGSCRTLTPREKEDPAGGLDELMAGPRRSRLEPTLSGFPNHLPVGDGVTDAGGEGGGASRPAGVKPAQ